MSLGEKAALNAAAAAAEDQEDCRQMWERTTWETGRATSGAEERKARNEEKGSSVEEEGRWRVWGKRLTSDLSGGSPKLFGAGRSAAPRGGD